MDCLTARLAGAEPPADAPPLAAEAVAANENVATVVAIPAERMTRPTTGYANREPFLFLAPTGLAVGLALKELALRRKSCDSPPGPAGPRGSPVLRLHGDRRLGFGCLAAGTLHNARDGCRAAATLSHVASDYSPQEVSELMQQGGIQLIDVREPYEHDAGRIAGDRLVGLTELAAQAETIDRDRPVVFYCRSGSRSAMATEAFRGAGYDAHNMEGGLLDWAAAGLPLEPDGGHVA